MNRQQMGGDWRVTEQGLYLRDTTIANATSARHGLLPKLSGVSTEFLNGVGAFATPAGGGGGWPLLGTYTASASASLDLLTRNASGQSGALVQSDFDTYVFYLLNLVPVTNAVNLHWRAGVGGVIDSSSLYALTAFRNSEGGQAANGNIVSSPTAQAILNNGDTVKNTATYGVCGVLTLFSPGSTSVYKRLDGYISWLASSATEIVRQDLNVTYENTAASDSCSFFFSSGNIASGIIRGYGVPKT